MDFVASAAVVGAEREMREGCFAMLKLLWEENRDHVLAAVTHRGELLLDCFVENMLPERSLSVRCVYYALCTVLCSVCACEVCVVLCVLCVVSLLSGCSVGWKCCVFLRAARMFMCLVYHAQNRVLRSDRLCDDTLRLEFGSGSGGRATRCQSDRGHICSSPLLACLISGILPSLLICLSQVFISPLTRSFVSGLSFFRLCSFL